MANARKAVLIVDPDVRSALTLERELVRAGYDAVGISSAESALDWLKSHSADLVLIDVLLPDPSGFEACQRLREWPEARRTPVIFLTGSGDVPAHGVARARPSGDVYLPRSLAPARLVTMVGMFLAQTPLVRRHNDVPPGGPGLSAGSIGTSPTSKGLGPHPR
jgi:DNA-binding response OmpR family regulator